MKKAILISMSVIILSVLFISEITHAQGKSDRGPLSKKVFIHYKKAKAKPERPVKPTKPPKDEEGSYTYISNGLKWKYTEDFVINASEGIADLVGLGMDEWEYWADADIFGNLYTGNVSVNSSVDNINAIIFAPLEEQNVIAVTSVWGYFYGPPKTREIIEADMIFNTNYAWGTFENDGAGVMDILNIATHELGHVAGMGDLYDTTTTEETMYGYSHEGETKKRDLYSGDKAGIKNLYQ
ncbi:MAG: matrixin family metalloprotease [Sedimentisphaerales bacterium]|nr:matrixin family metalloprotease [Sedimentisphaerales bacterium]